MDTVAELKQLHIKIKTYLTTMLNNKLISHTIYNKLLFYRSNHGENKSMTRLKLDPADIQCTEIVS